MKLTNILKIFAPAAVILCFYPVTALLGAFADITPVQGMIFTGVTVLTVWYAMAARRCCEYIEIHNEIAGRIVHILLGALPLLFTYIMIQNLTGAKKTILIFAVPAVITAYVIGSRAVYKSYREIFPSPLLAVEAAADIICCGVLFAAEKSYDIDMFCATFAVVSVIFVCICSQGGIDANMGRIRRGNEHLPPKIRSYSMKLLAFVGALGMFLYLMKDIIIRFIYVLIELLVLLVKGVLKLSEWYASLFETPEDMEQAEEKAAEYVIDSAASQILNLILNIAFVVIPAIMIWKFREQIYDGIMRVVRSVSRKFHELMNRRRSMEEMSEEGYSDAAEYLSPAVREKKSARKAASAGRWKRSFRRYRAMKSGSEKLRMGCGLAAEGLRLCGKEVPDSLTAAEIGDIMSEYTDKYPDVCGEYENVRYGFGPTEKLGISEEMLEDILYVISKNIK